MARPSLALLALAFALVGSALLAGCGSGGSTDGMTATPPSTTAGGLPAPSAAPAGGAGGTAPGGTTPATQQTPSIN